MVLKIYCFILFFLSFTKVSYSKFSTYERYYSFNNKTFEIEYNYYKSFANLEQNSFTGNSGVTLDKTQDKNVSDGNFNELSLIYNNFLNGSFVFNYFTNNVYDVNKWSKGSSLSRYTFSYLYDVFKFNIGNVSKLGIAVEYTKYIYNNSSVIYKVDWGGGRGIIPMSSDDEYRYDIKNLESYWTSYFKGKRYEILFTFGLGYSFLNLEENILEIYYDQDPSIFPMTTVTLSKGINSFNGNGYTAAFDFYIILMNKFALFSNIKFQKWFGTAENNYIEYSTTVKRIKYQYGAGLHYNDNFRILFSIAYDIMENNLVLSNYENELKASHTFQFNCYNLTLSYIF